MTELSFETYQYENGLFAAADYDSFSPSMPLLEHRKYRFHRDEAGFLCSYQVEEYDGDVLKSGFWDGHIFVIPESKKRN